MKRNMNLRREILLAIKNGDDGSGKWVPLTFKDIEKPILIEHLMLLDEAGMIEGNNTSSLSHRDYQVQRLTSTGHDFLDSIRDPGIWNAIKSKLGNATGTTTLGVIKALIVQYAAEKLGLKS